MIKPNIHYADLKDSYLFYNIAQKTKAYLEANPDKHLYRMGIGDVSLPLCDAVIKALHEAVEDQATKDNFHGYMPECGASFLKDAVVASMLVCELAAYWKDQGKSVADAMDALYQTYGQYISKVQSVELTGADAMEKAAAMMATLRSDIPRSIGGATVTVVRDYKSGIAKDILSGVESTIDLPSSNVLEFVLGDSGSVIARPSGTEPKVKFYYTAVAESKENAELLLSRMMEQMSV